MNVNELREHDAVESVEDADDYWLVTPVSDAYDEDDYRLSFLLKELNVVFEYGDGTLKVPKYKITK